MPPKTTSGWNKAAQVVAWAVLAGGFVWGTAVAHSKIEQNAAKIKDLSAQAVETDHRNDGIEKQLASINTHLEHIREDIQSIR